MARYSFRHRGPRTGLLRNQPVNKRWDYHVCTTEVGLWAGCLLRAADLTGIEEFRTMADEAVSAYLRLGYDPQAGLYAGCVRVEDGKPEAARQTEYQPGRYADVWEPLFPTHDYPMPMAEACLTLYERTRHPRFREAVARWTGHVRKSVPARGGRGAYAEHYGRCIHFLVRAANVLDDREAFALAGRIATEAVAHLHCPAAGMFRSHPGEDRCDAVDGLGILFLALIYLETGADPDGMGFAF